MSSKKSYVSVTDSMMFSSLSLSHSPATNFTGHARESDQRRRVRPSRSCCTMSRLCAPHAHRPRPRRSRAVGQGGPVETAPQTELDAALRRVAELEAALSSVTATLSKSHDELASVRAERDKLRRAYDQLKTHLELLRRRIFIAKAERIDTAQLEMEFAETTAKLEKLATELGEDAGADGASDDAGRPSGKRPKTSKGSGRPNLRALG